LPHEFGFSPGEYAAILNYLGPQAVEGAFGQYNPGPYFKSLTYWHCFIIPDMQVACQRFDTTMKQAMRHGRIEESGHHAAV
jgi:hypothetical protein